MSFTTASSAKAETMPEPSKAFIAVKYWRTGVGIASVVIAVMIFSLSWHRADWTHDPPCCLLLREGQPRSPPVPMLARERKVVSVADFHPDLARAARFIPRTLITPYTLPLLRGADRLLSGRGRSATDVEVLTLASGVGVRLHRPPGATESAPGMVWIHGGGYVIGRPAQDDGICRRFARELGITVAAVDYRLAPEYPYPI